MKILSKVFLVSAIIIAFTGCEKKIEKIGRPNIIFLMDDQHRWDALGIVNEKVHTPNLDALAKNGVFYDQAVCQAPMCIASRNSMMLGLYPNQVGIFRNEPGIPDKELPALPLAEVLKQNGYETAGFGKAHWGLECSTRGFETRYIGECREKDAVMMIDVDSAGKERYNEEVKAFGPGEEGIPGYIGLTSNVNEEDHRDGWVFNQCLDFINKRTDNRPLFLYLSFLKPHAGHNVPKGYEDFYAGEDIDYPQQPNWGNDYSPHAEGINRREMYEGFWKNASVEEWKTMTKRYWANCSWIDDMFGRTLEALKKKGLLDNTLIVYVSDHGEMLGERYYRFNKYCLYESSVRVPIILSGSALPENLRGKIKHENAELVDIYPTVLDVAGIPVPKASSGMSLLEQNQRLGNFCALHERKDEAAFMWRTPKYKLILRMKRKEDASQYSKSDIIGGEFYDLTNDPKEWVDLYEKNQFQEIKQNMEEELLQQILSMKKFPRLK